MKNGRNYYKKYYYVFDDVTRNGAAEYYENKRYFCLVNGGIIEEYLVRKNTLYQDVIPEVTLTYQPVDCDTTNIEKSLWDIKYGAENSWKKIKKEKGKNRSFFKVDIIVYPELAYKNLIIT